MADPRWKTRAIVQASGLIYHAAPQYIAKPRTLNKDHFPNRGDVEASNRSTRAGSITRSVLTAGIVSKKRRYVGMAWHCIPSLLRNATESLSSSSEHDRFSTLVRRGKSDS